MKNTDGIRRVRTRKAKAVVRNGKSRLAMAFVLSAMLVIQSLVPLNAAFAAAGSIWTTNSSCGEPQNSNQYAVGESVYINGSGFEAGTEYPWEIVGHPGSSDPDASVANGNEITDENGDICFEAYEVMPGDDGVYKAGFGDKNDNYSVKEDCKTAEDSIVADPCNEEDCDEESPTVNVEVNAFIVAEADDCVEEEDPGCDEVVADKSFFDSINPFNNEENECNEPEEPKDIVSIWGDKVVCLTEADLPNWGDVSLETDEPSMIDANTAANYADNSNGRCWLQEDWSFQYGFAEKDDTSGVHKLPGDHLGQADGTSTAGLCNATFCGDNTYTGAGFADWKTFDTTTTVNGTISALAEIEDLEGAPGIWVRENLKDGYTPFTYPPDGAPGSNVSAEMYCHNDIQNYDNYDEIILPQLGMTYVCVAFNVLEGVTIEANKVVCLNESDLPNWGEAGLQEGEPSMITQFTAEDYLEGKGDECHMEEDWSFQYGFAEKDDTSGVHKLPGDHLGQADGTSTAGLCNATFCGDNTYTGGGFADWKNFDTSTTGGGFVNAVAKITDLEGSTGVWVRENLQDGYVPFTYPPDSAPGSNVSAEIYCHNDIQNYDNYDEVLYPEMGETYYCVAFNAIEDSEGGGDGNGDGPYTLTVTIADGENDGEGSVSGTGIDCDSTATEESLGGNDCSETYPAGTMVTLTVTPKDGSSFEDSWLVGAGTCTGTTTPCQVTMNNDIDLTAHFSVDNGQGGDGGSNVSSGSSRSSGSSSGSSSNDDGDDGVVEGIDTGMGGAGPQPEVLGATLPRTGASLWLIAPILGALFLLGGMLRTRKA